MAVRSVNRRGERRLVIDIRYQNPDGTSGRYRHDAEVQMLAAARAEDRRRLVALAATGSPTGPAGPVHMETAAAASMKAKPRFPTFGEVVKMYLSAFAPSHLKPSSLFGYRAVLEKLLVPKLGKKTLDEIDASIVRKLDAELVHDGKAPSTRRNVQAILRSVLCRYAVEAGILGEPPSFPRLPKVGRKVLDTLSPEEMKKILAAACERHQLAFKLAALAGLRAGEVRGLRWKDVDLKQGRLVVRQSICRGVAAAPKSGHERIVPLLPDLKEAIDRVKRGEPHELVARNADGDPWSEFALGLAFRRACERAEVRAWRFHDLRHYFVTALFRAGVPANAVQALAGHADLGTTQRYAHVTPLDLRAAIERLAASSG
jgi:integrase